MIKHKHKPINFTNHKINSEIQFIIEVWMFLLPSPYIKVNHSSVTTVWVLGFVSYYSIFGTLVPVHHIKNHIHVQQLTVIQQSPTHIT